MGKSRVPKFRDNDREDRRRTRKKNRPKKPYSRSEKHRKSWEEHIDNEENRKR